MKKFIRYLPLLLIFILSLTYFSYDLFKIRGLYSYDAFFQIGLSQMFFETGKINSIMKIPYSLEPVKNPIGYYQFIPILHLILKTITGLDNFIIAKLIILFTIFLLNIFIFITIRRIFKKIDIATFAVILINFIPIIHYRFSMLVPENIAVILFLSMFFCLTTYNLWPLLLILPFSLAIHPKSLIIFLPVLFFYFTLYNKKFNKKNYFFFFLLLIILFVPFIYPFFDILSSLLINKGSTYPLFPPISVIPLTLTLFNNIVGFMSISIILLGLLSLFYLKNRTSLLLLIWTSLTFLLLIISIFMNFPTNRILLYPAILVPFLLSSFLFFLQIKFNSRLKYITIFLIIVIIILSFFYSTYHRPFLGWGDEEEYSMIFLKDSLNNLEDYVIITPEYSLPFGYGLKHIELNELKISEIFNQTDISEFKKNLYTNYPFTENFYIILGYYSCNYLTEKKAIKDLCKTKENIFFSNNRVKIFLLKNENNNTWIR